MNVTHRLALLALLAGGLALPAAAQQRPARPAPTADAPTHARRDAARTPAQRLDRHLAQLDRQLNLTDPQEAQIRRILQDRAARRPAPQPRAEAPRTRPTPEQQAQRRTERHAAMEETQRAILAVLTPQQAETFRRLQAERQDRHRQHHKDGRLTRPEGRRGRTPR